MENKQGYDLSFKKAWATPILRWILGITILAIVFSFGVKLGEIKSFVEGELGYGYYGSSSSCPFMNGSYRAMTGTGNYGNSYGSGMIGSGIMGPSMMGGWQQGPTSQPQTLPPTIR